MNYGLMKYNFGDHFNIGDYLQSIAARQFLPRVDHYISREGLHEYSGPPVKMILNGFFMRDSRRWPPVQNIMPLFVSFHMNIERAEGMLRDGGVAYLKRHGPIGCRDISTLRIMEENGIQAYLSGCLTLTLGRTYRHTADEDVYLVDVLPGYPTGRSVFKSFNTLRKSVTSGNIFLLGKRKKLIADILGNDIAQTAREITHVYPADHCVTEESRFALTDSTMKRYERARLVITSRIHCALPCLAMGTPVVFVDGGFQPSRSCRFGGLTDLFNTVSVSRTGDVTANFDLQALKATGTVKPRTEHVKYLEPLSKRCQSFIDDAT